VTSSVTRASVSHHFTGCPKAGVADRQATGERGKCAKRIGVPWGVGQLSAECWVSKGCDILSVKQ